MYEKYNNNNNNIFFWCIEDFFLRASHKLSVHTYTHTRSRLLPFSYVGLVYACELCIHKYVCMEKGKSIINITTYICTIPYLIYISIVECCILTYKRTTYETRKILLRIKSIKYENSIIFTRIPENVQAKK